jgi:superoxide reductase
MTKRLEIYKCDICGNIVELLHEGVGQLVCCGQPMRLFSENYGGPALGIHVPVIEKIPGGVRIKVGSIAHPMEEEHYIQWIEVIADGRVYRKFLNKGDAPEAEFNIEGPHLRAREYCKQHGLWSA